MNRSEIVFVYDIVNANPNGDPLDEDKPRIDEETGKNLVTDVRLKRTIRDYLHIFENEDIFVKEIFNKQGEIQTGKERAEDYLEGVEGLDNLDYNKQRTIIKNKILEEAIDVRLFGATIPLELQVKGKKKKKKTTGTITLTGPVQFRMGQSLHRVELKHIKGTGAFASKKGKTRKTFREEDILPYSLICFYGIVNENAAKHTKLSEEDVKKMTKGLWWGTKTLITRSKFGQIPRLLLRVEYKEKNYHIGDLEKFIKLEKNLEDEKIRDISEVTLDLTSLGKILNKNKEKIEKICLKKDERTEVKGLDGLNVEELKF